MTDPIITKGERVESRIRQAFARFVGELPHCMTVSEARAAARKAVTECPSKYFKIEKETIPEGPFETVEDYQRVIRNPASFFMCRVCATSGPWHRSWAGSSSDLRGRLGPCCTGAD